MSQEKKKASSSFAFVEHISSISSHNPKAIYGKYAVPKRRKLPNNLSGCKKRADLKLRKF